MSGQLIGAGLALVMMIPVVIAGLLVQRSTGRWKRGQLNARQLLQHSALFSAVGVMVPSGLLMAVWPGPALTRVAIVVSAVVLTAVGQVGQLLWWYDPRYWGGRLARELKVDRDPSGERQG